MQKVLQIIDVISLITGKIVSFLILIIVGITVYEVILRYVFNSPTTWAFELNYLIFGAYSILGGAYTFYLKGHVNVDILYGRLSLKKLSLIHI